MLILRRAKLAEREHVRYVQVTWRAYKQHPTDVLAQADFVASHSTQRDLLLHLLYAAQHKMHIPSFEPEPYPLARGSIDLLLCGFLAAVNRMEPGLPEGVYAYILGNVEQILRRLCV